MTMTNRRNVRNRRGATLIYMLMLMIALLMFASLGVDVARVQMAKTELRTAVDSAARYAAIGLDRDGATAISNATDIASHHRVRRSAPRRLEHATCS